MARSPTVLLQELISALREKKPYCVLCLRSSDVKLIPPKAVWRLLEVLPFMYRPFDYLKKNLKSGQVCTWCGAATARAVKLLMHLHQAEQFHKKALTKKGGPTRASTFKDLRPDATVMRTNMLIVDIEGMRQIPPSSSPSQSTSSSIPKATIIIDDEDDNPPPLHALRPAMTPLGPAHTTLPIVPPKVAQLAQTLSAMHPLPVAKQAQNIVIMDAVGNMFLIPQQPIIKQVLPETNNIITSAVINESGQIKTEEPEDPLDIKVDDLKPRGQPMLAINVTKTHKRDNKNTRNSHINCENNDTGLKITSCESQRATKRNSHGDKVDWEDKIPMDVISFMDASDPLAMPQTETIIVPD